MRSPQCPTPMVLFMVGSGSGRRLDIHPCVAIPGLATSSNSHTAVRITDLVDRDRGNYR